MALDGASSIAIKFEPSNDDETSLPVDDDDEGDDPEQSTSSDPDSKSSSRQKTQRNRTAFTQEQIAALEKGKRMTYFDSSDHHCTRFFVRRI
jgi:hypothetical protein